MAVTPPQSERLSAGFMAGAGLYRTLGDVVGEKAGEHLTAGLRLSAGMLFDGDAPARVGVRDYGAGGFLGASLAVRVRPLGAPGAGLKPDSRQLGPWLELGAGAGLTGELVRPAFEAGAGYLFVLPVRLFGQQPNLGPAVRYLRVVAPSGGLDDRSANLVLLGVELGLFDREPTLLAPMPDPEPAPAPEPPPPSDRDGDGILDTIDRCPNEPEDVDGVQDDDGCPEDNDGDGIPDDLDKCPTESETINGIDDEDGCPDKGEIEMLEGRVILEEAVLFDLNRSRIKRSGRRALMAIVRLWKQHPEWVRMEIEGHASADGPEDYNLSLSNARAQRVADALVELGFERAKLSARGFGSSRPRDKRETPEGYARNRRVEFVIIDRAPAPLLPSVLPGEAPPERGP